MATDDFIIELFYRIDDVLREAEKDGRAKPSPSGIVTLAILFAIKGVGNSAFYRFLRLSVGWQPRAPMGAEGT